jgi:ankyrin repeat protein
MIRDPLAVYDGRTVVEGIVERGTPTSLAAALRKFPPAQRTEIVNRCNATVVPPLFVAVAQDSWPLKKALVTDYGADVNWRHPNGLTCLLIASQSGYSEAACYLASRPGINIAVSLDDGNSPMHFAVWHNDARLVENKNLPALESMRTRHRSAGKMASQRSIWPVILGATAYSHE